METVRMNMFEVSEYGACKEFNAVLILEEFADFVD
tara:strand:+ start:11664 stop:11768 length:105 start_codon:yes stop_codon:yes gene_type:complete